MKAVVIFFVVWLIITVGPTRSAPIVGNVSIESGNVTLSGSGFGNHPLQIQWLGGSKGPIESMPPGAIQSIINWSFSTNRPILIATDHAHSGAKSIKSVIENNLPGQALISNEWINRIHGGQRIFVSWWVMRDHNGPCLWKLFRLNGQNNTSRPYPQLSMLIYPFNSAKFIVRPGPEHDLNVLVDQLPHFPEQDNRWYRMDMNILSSSAGLKNGTCVISRHDPISNTVIKSRTIENMMSFFFFF